MGLQPGWALAFRRQTPLAAAAPLHHRPGLPRHRPCRRPRPRARPPTLVIGCNGSGKSSFAEALVCDGPVLLDDVIDSGWTLTVIAALLRQAGVPTVYPVVLASTGYR